MPRCHLRAKGVEKREKDKLDQMDRDPREGKKKEKKRPTTVTIPWDQATWRSEEGALHREKPRESARQGGGSRAPTMRHRNREIGGEFRGRDKTWETMRGEDRIGEARGFGASIEIIVTDPGTKDLARKMKGVKFNNG